MKHYITRPLEGERNTLRIQTEGIERAHLSLRLMGSCIVAYSLPVGQSLENSWQCRIHFGNNDVLEFSSVCTEVDGWQEIGSLSIRVLSHEEDDPLFNLTEIEIFRVAEIECLVYDDVEVFSECGLILKSDLEEEIIIAAGVSPGSVSVKAPFSSLPFEPELLPEHYKRLPI